MCAKTAAVVACANTVDKRGSANLAAGVAFVRTSVCEACVSIVEAEVFAHTDVSSVNVPSVAVPTPASTNGESLPAKTV